jgi:acyl-CoA synthetase (AMP-forming)/AMP-acid ligase II
MMERFDAEQFLKLVDQYKVTHSLLVPTMFSRLLALPTEVRESYSVSSLEAIAHSAAPCRVSVKRRMIEWFGPIIFETYGASESNGIATVDSHEWLAKPGTVGRAAVGEIVILDDEGAECPTGTPGNIWFRGATNFVYFGDEKKTSEGRDAAGTMSTTGDIGYLDEDGYLFLTDRVAFMIVSGGVNIYPQEVENVLSEHPLVADVAVLGVPNEDKGEEVKAVVQLVADADRSPATVADLIKFCDGRLAKYKWPKSIDFVDEVPRSTMGKIDKRMLQRQYWKGHETLLL